MMKILFLVPYPTEGASNRVRVEQYLPYLKERGVTCRVRPFVNRPFYRVLYLPHRYAAKAFWFIVCTVNRAFDLARALQYTIVFVHREAYPFGGPVFESLLRAMGKRIVFDFDDAVFLPNTSRHNIAIERFKRPEKVAAIIRMSSLVIAGNDYLRRYAERFNPNVVVIPSPVDTARFVPSAAGETQPAETLTIGWVGSGTTKDFLEGLKDVFAALAERYRHVRFKFVGARFYGADPARALQREWSLDREVAEIQSFDIGIMPMPDNEWTRGKCAFKALLYMACGIPVVASPVGMNAEVVADGVNGFLARTNDEWFARCAALIEDGGLRRAMGQKGRVDVERRYSLAVASPLLYESIRKVSEGRPR